MLGDCLISTMGFPTMVRSHLYFDSRSWLSGQRFQSQYANSTHRGQWKLVTQWKHNFLSFLQGLICISLAIPFLPWAMTGDRSAVVQVVTWWKHQVTNNYMKQSGLTSMPPGPQFIIKMSSYQYRKPHWGDKTVVRLSYLHNGISYTGKTTSLYWIRALESPGVNPPPPPPPPEVPSFICWSPPHYQGSVHCPHLIARSSTSGWS